MTSSKWLRIAALGVLVALAFHGAAALAHQHEPGAERDCTVCHFGHLHALAPELPDHPQVLPRAELLAAEPALSAEPIARTLPPSRGPPA
jgi:hypothetical protein